MPATYHGSHPKQTGTIYTQGSPIQFEISNIDLAILLFYLVASRAAALWLGRGQKDDSSGFFLGGRSFTWPLIGFSLFATNMSGSSFVGLAGAGYGSGIAAFSYEWMAAFILVIFIFFILPFYLRTGVFTIPEFLERRYDRRSRYLFAGLLLFLNVFLDCAGALYAGGLVTQTLFPAMPLSIAVLGLALLAMVLSISGGLGAVVISDAIQASVLILGGVIIFFAAWAAIPSWDAVREAAPEGALSIIQPIGDPDLPWPGLLTGVIVIGIYFWVTNQLIVQRVLGAKNLDHGRWGSLFAGFLKLPILFIMILPGTMATVLYPDLPTPDLAFPALAFDLMPTGVRGIILAALVAAITSSVDSILNSASTLVTMDFVRPLRPHTSEHALVRTGRITTAAVTAIAVVWSPQIARFPSLWQYLQSTLSYVTPPVVAVFLIGIFWRRASATAAFATLLVGILGGVSAFVVVEVLNFYAIQFLYSAGIAFAVGVGLMVTLSLVTAPKDNIDGLIWTPVLWHEETAALRSVPRWKNYRVISVALIVCTAALVIAFW
ncbi:MAG: sodium:solute symporter [Myxococcota bacterium]